MHKGKVRCFIFRLLTSSQSCGCLVYVAGFVAIVISGHMSLRVDLITATQAGFALCFSIFNCYSSN